MNRKFMVCLLSVFVLGAGMSFGVSARRPSQADCWNNYSYCMQKTPDYDCDANLQYCLEHSAP